MARRNDHTSQQLSDKIIASAIEFLQHQPIRDLSLRALAKSVGYSAGTLINLFRNYNLLLLAVSGYTLDQIHQQLNDDVTKANKDNASQLIVSLALEYLQFASDHPSQWRQVFEHKLDSGLEINLIHQHKIDRLFCKVEPLLKQLAPQAIELDIIKASRTLWASVHGICLMSIEDKLFMPTQVTSEALIESLINHYLTSWVDNQTKESFYVN